MTFAETIKSLKPSLFADELIDLADTAILLRAVAPFVRAGNRNAIILDRMLREVREDGTITKEESDQMLKLLSNLLDSPLK